MPMSLPAPALEHTREMARLWQVAVTASGDGRYDDAVDSFSKVLKLFPQEYAGDTVQYGAHCERGECYTGVKQFNKAVDDFNWCLQYKPNDEAVIFCRAETYANWGKWVDAAHDYGRCVELKPKDSDNIAHYARALIKLKQYAKAIHEYDMILRATPEDDDVWRARADAELLQGNYKEAADNYSKAIGYDSDVGWYYNYRARAYEKLGKPDLAAKDRKKAQEMHFKEKPGDLGL